MIEDPLLRELGHLAKKEKEAEQARLDERWDRLAAGTLTPEEDAELRALAEISPEARMAHEAFRPLGADFQARVVNALASELERTKPARLLPFRFTARRAGWLTAATAAAAAVLVLVLRPPAPLPAYSSLDISGGSRTMRGEETEGKVPDFAPGDSFKIILRPRTAESRAQPEEAQAFLLRDRELRRLEAQSEFDPGGAVKMEGSLGRDLQPGIWTLWAVVGRRGKLPDPADVRSLAARAEVRRRDWVAMSKDIRIRSQAP